MARQLVVRASLAATLLVAVLSANLFVIVAVAVAILANAFARLRYLEPLVADQISYGLTLDPLLMRATARLT